MSTEDTNGIHYNKFKIDIDESGNSFWYNSDELYFIHGNNEEETKTNNKKQRRDGRRKDCALILFGYLCCDGYYNCL